MSYLCGMKSAIRLAFVTFLLYAAPLKARAQGGFAPSGTFSPGSVAYIDSLRADTILTFSTNFSLHSIPDFMVDGAFIPLSNNVIPGIIAPGITYTPTYFECSGDCQVNVTVYVNLDSAQACLNEPLSLEALYDSDGFVGHLDAFLINGYLYDPKIKGRVHLGRDTLDFGAVPVGSVADIAPAISVDTVGSIFRKLIPLNVWAPFTAWDSITPQFDSCYLPNGGGDFYFSPTAIGHYIDTTYLYDPIRKDSTMLILLGEGVAAGVSPDVAEPNSLRINPNPCDRSAAISLSGEDIEEVTIQNILGERVLESRMEPGKSFSLNTSELPDGIYFVEVRSRSGRYRQRIIVSH